MIMPSSIVQAQGTEHTRDSVADQKLQGTGQLDGGVLIFAGNLKVRTEGHNLVFDNSLYNAVDITAVHIHLTSGGGSVDGTLLDLKYKDLKYTCGLANQLYDRWVSRPQESHIVMLVTCQTTPVSIDMAEIS